MRNISMNMLALEVRTDALRAAGETFTEQSLEPIDIRSTLSIVQHSINAHEATNQNHISVGEYLIDSANLIVDIGEGFFELDQDIAVANGNLQNPNIPRMTHVNGQWTKVQPASPPVRTITLNNGRIVNLQTTNGKIVNGNLQNPNVPCMINVNGRWTLQGQENDLKLSQVLCSCFFVIYVR